MQLAEVARSLAKGLSNSAILVEDRAFYPMQAGSTSKASGHVMNTEGEPPYGRSKRPFEYDPLKEPESDAMGYEGAGPRRGQPRDGVPGQALPDHRE